MSALSAAFRRVWRQRAALLAFYASRLALAVLLVSPVARLLVASGVGGNPRGDAMLFDDGGVVFVEAVRASHAVLRAELRDAFWLGALFSWLLLLPFGGLLAALAEDTRLRVVRAWQRGTQLFASFTLLGGIAWLAQGVLATLAVVAAVAVQRRATAAAERSTDLATLGLVAVGALAYGIVSVIHDLARVEVVVHGHRPLRAIPRALSLLAARPLSLLGVASSVPLASLGVIAAAARITSLSDVSRPGAWRVGLVLLAHQAAALGLASLRASFVAYAIELSSGSTPESDDRSASSVEPAGPTPDPGA